MRHGSICLPRSHLCDILKNLMHLSRVLILFVLLAVAARYANAQVLTNTWSLAGGGLNPTNYGGNFRPSVLASDTGSTGTATIGMSGLSPTSGGLGSTALGAYGGIYSFFSSGLALNLQVTNVSSGIVDMTFGFLGGGGSPVLTYSNSSLSLNFNAGNTAVASSSFSAVPGIVVDSPIGEQELTAYTWRWTNLSLLGSSSMFSIAWTAPRQHAFITDIVVTQTVPEPSVFALLVIGAAGLWFLRNRTRNQ
jgi:hypothetical protein